MCLIKKPSFQKNIVVSHYLLMQYESSESATSDFSFHLSPLSSYYERSRSPTPLSLDEGYNSRKVHYICVYTLHSADIVNLSQVKVNLAKVKKIYSQKIQLTYIKKTTVSQ